MGIGDDSPSCASVSFNPETWQQDCSAYNAILYALWKIGEFVDSHSGAFTTLATVAIAAFTLTLWQSTNKLWLAGERHSERELRAYVFVDGGQFDYSSTHEAFRGHLVIKNYGKTPAYDLEVFASVRVFEPDVPIFDFAQLHPEKSARTPLGPGAEINIDRTIRARPNDLQEVIDREKAIFMWGKASYRDAFGNGETLEFRCVNMRVRDTSNTWVMQPYPESSDGRVKG
jgi:hypothetical protein